MNRAEDTQPSESVHGRPKRVLPSIKDTSRVREEPKGRGGGSNHRGRRGQPSSRGFGRGMPVSRPAPHYATGSNSHPLPPRPQPTWATKANTIQPVASVPKKPASGSISASSHVSAQPRRKFVPNTHGQPRERVSSASHSDSMSSPLCGQLDSSANTSLDTAGPPSKRQRTNASSVVAPSTTPTDAPTTHVVKPEEDKPQSISSPSQTTSGTKFIGYDQYPKCRFSCGLKPNKVLDNRSAVRGNAVRDLQKQGFKVDAVLMRDDGIAIDWSLPADSQTSQPAPRAISPIPEPGQHLAGLEDGIYLASFFEQDSIPPWDPPSSPRPFSDIAYIPSFHHSTTPESAEILFREIIIPAQCLSTQGDARELETWVVEQMNQLKVELGPVLIPPSEVVGVDEHLVAQHTSSNIKPYVRIRYKRPASMMTLPELSLCDTPQVDTGGTTTLPKPARIISGSPTIPPIAHLPQASSPMPRDSSPFVFKSEPDELALDPPSPCPMPEIASSNAFPTSPTQTSSDMSNIGQISRSINEQPRPVSAADSDTDEIQRLRRDLEASRLEAEQKHRDLERRILQLSQNRPESGTPEVEVASSVTYNANHGTRVEIVDESKPNILVLRRGKHDKTRRLLSPSQSTALHISWLGAMQLVNQNTREIVASGFDEGAPDGVSVEDACLLSESSVAVALSGNECQLGITTIGEKSFKYRPLLGRPHEAKGICAVVPVSSGEAISLGHDRSYVHWRFDNNACSTNTLPMPKLHQCTTLAYEPAAGNIITAGSDYSKRGKMSVYSLHDSRRIPTLVELSNHVHRIHTDMESPSLIILELTRLDDQFQVHDMRLPLYQSVQKFGYQSMVHEKGAFRTRGCMKGHFFSRGDVGLARVWDRRNLSAYQTISVIPHQKTVDLILNGTSLICATESHQVVSYPML